MATAVMRVTSIDVPTAINLSVDDDAIIAIAMEPLRAIPVRDACAVSISNSVFIIIVHRSSFVLRRSVSPLILALLPSILSSTRVFNLGLINRSNSNGVV